LRNPQPAGTNGVVPHGARSALRGAAHVPLWLDSSAAPDPRDALVGARRADLVVVGAGFTGLWSALRALERDPGRKVVIVEGARIASAASGRNGGFVDASLTHGLENGVSRFASEIDRLVAMGADNLDGIEATIARERIDCGFERVGSIDVATAPWQAASVEDAARLALAHGEDVEVLERSALRDRVDSPTYLGGVFHRRTTALVDPARLAWGLASAIEARGGIVLERSPVTSLEAVDGAVRCSTERGTVVADRAVVATSAFPPLVRRVRRYVIPVYDYVLATEPLDVRRRAALRWQGREGLSDMGNQFHYYRLTPDDRVLFGGYDALYYFNGAMGPRREVRPATFALLAGHFFETFPQLSGVRFTHAWGGAIDTCSRFRAFYGTAHNGRVAYAAGFTGLGVGASRFAADVLLDLLSGAETERTSLEMVRSMPVPFPPEPLRSAVVAMTRHAIARADAADGRRGAWLRLLDRLGLGFDS